MSSHHIGQVMGGYLDENSKLMDRPELNKRIGIKDAEIERLTKELKDNDDLATTAYMVGVEKGKELREKRIKELEAELAAKDYLIDKIKGVAYEHESCAWCQIVISQLVAKYNQKLTKNKTI